MKIIIIENIFNRKKRQEIDVPLINPTPLLQVIDKKYHKGYKISISSCGLINPKDYSKKWITNKDEIVILPDIKDAATFVAIVAAIIGAGTLATVIGYTLFALTWLTLGYSIYRAMMAKVPAYSGGEASDSPIYGWESAQTTSESDIPKPILLGKHRLAGNIIDYYVEEDNRKQYLNVLLALGEGKFHSIGGIEENLNDLENPTEIYIKENIIGKTGGIKFPFVKFDGVNCSGVDKTTGYLIIDLRCSDPEKLTANGVLELTSINNPGFIVTFPFNEIIFSESDIKESIRYEDLTKIGISTEWKTFLIPLNDFIESDIPIEWGDINYIRWVNYSIDGVGDDTVEIAFANVKIQKNNLSTAIVGDKIKIDKQPITNFKNVQIYVRLGQEEQESIPGFQSIHNYINFGQDYLLDLNIPRIITTEKTNVESVIFHFSFPNGLFKLSKEGKKKSITVTYRIRHKIHGQAGWIDLGRYSITDCTMSATFRCHKIENLEPNWYDFEVIKLTGVMSTTKITKMYLMAIDEIRYRTLTYPFTALIAFRILGTDQISGSIPNFSILCEGLEVNIFNGSSDERVFSSNSIWCLREILENKRIGLGSRIPLYTEDELINLQLEAEYCDEDVADTGELEDKRFELNYVIDANYKALDVITHICSTFRCLPFWSEGKVKLVIEREAIPTQLFTMGNIKEDSFKEQFLSIKDEYNIIEVQFYDQDYDNTRNVATVVNDEAYTIEKPIQKRTFHFPGITKKSHAIRIGTFLLKLSQLKRAISWEAGIDAVTCSAGDVINFAHDITAYGISSGIILSGTSVQNENGIITLNNSVVLQPGEIYYIKIRYNDDNGESKKIISPSGIYESGESITVEGNFTQCPQYYDKYTIGKQNLECKPFRIVQINQKSNFEISITATEYYAALYDMSGVSLPEIKYTNLIDPLLPPKNVENLYAYNSGTYDSTIYVSFTKPEITDFDDDGNPILQGYGIWNHAEIYLSTDEGETWLMHGITTIVLYKIMNLVPGQLYYIKVVSVSKWSVKTDFATSPICSILVVNTQLPPDVKGLELKGQGNDNEFKTKNAHFVWNEISYSTAYQPSSEDLGAGQGMLENFFKDYLIEIWTNGILVRMEYVLTNEFIYTYEKNTDDNNIATREFIIKVYARDIFNRQSINPAQLFVKNPQCIQPTGLVATGSFRSIWVNWDENSESDLEGYILKRSKTPGFAWNNGTIIYEGKSTAITDIRDNDDDPDVTYYYRVAAYDLFDQFGMTPTEVVEAHTSFIDPTDITNFAIDASKIFSWIPILEGEVWQDNSPSVGYISWNAHNLYFKGCKYKIATGSSNKKFIYWLFTTPPTGEIEIDSIYYESNEHPGDLGYLGDKDFIIVTNTDGFHDAAWNAIANMVIGTAYILNASIITAKIQDLAVTTAKIEDLAVITAKINDLAVTTAKIDNLAVTNAQIKDLSAEKINAGDIVTERLQVNVANAVNLGSVLIEPGRILISGAGESWETTLADWRGGVNLTEILGGAIAANTILANSIVIGCRGVTIEGLKFYYDLITNKVKWESGKIYFLNDDNIPTEKSISGNPNGTQWSSGTVYIYWVKGDDELLNTIDKLIAFTDDTIVMATYTGGNGLIANYGRALIQGADIIANSITVNELSVNNLSSITSDMGSIESGEIILTADSTNLIKINSSGIYVSTDGGSSWKAVIGLEDGEFKLLFGSYDADSQLSHLRLRGPNGWIDWETLFDSLSEGDPGEGIWTSWNQTEIKEIENYNQGIKIKTTLNASGGASPASADVFIQYELWESGGSAAIWSLEEWINIAYPDSYEFSSHIIFPCFEGNDFFPGDNCYVKMRAKFTNQSTSGFVCSVSTDVNIHTLGYVDGIYKIS